MSDIIEIGGELYSVDIAGETVRGTRIQPIADDGEPILTFCQMEELAIERALRRFKGNKTRVAGALGVDRRTLYRMIERMKAKEAA